MTTGDMSLTAKNNWTDDTKGNCRKAMNPNNTNMQYWFVAMGKSTLGSSYAFSAGRYLFYPDNTPPQVISLATTVDASTILTIDPEKAINTAYSGTVTITFSTPLHYKTTVNKKTVYLPVVDKKLEEVVDRDSYASSDLLLTASKVVAAIEHNGDANTPDNTPCYALTISYKNIRPNATIALSTYLSTSKGITGKEPLAIVMNLVKNADGFYMPQFKIANRGTEWGNPTVN